MDELLKKYLTLKSNVENNLEAMSNIVNTLAISHQNLELQNAKLQNELHQSRIAELEKRVKE